MSIVPKSTYVHRFTESNYLWLYIQFRQQCVLQIRSTDREQMKKNGLIASENIQTGPKRVNHVPIKQPTWAWQMKKCNSAIQRSKVDKINYLTWSWEASFWVNLTGLCSWGEKHRDKSIQPKDSSERKQSNLHSSNRYRGRTVHIKRNNRREICLRDMNNASAIPSLDSRNNSFKKKAKTSADTKSANAIRKFGINEFRHQDQIGPTCEHQPALTGWTFGSYLSGAHYNVVSCVGTVCGLFPNPLSFSSPLRIIPSLPLPALSSRPISIRPSYGQSMQTAVRWGLEGSGERKGTKRMSHNHKHPQNTNDQLF